MQRPNHHVWGRVIVGLLIMLITLILAVAIHWPAPYLSFLRPIGLGAEDLSLLGVIVCLPLFVAGIQVIKSGSPEFPPTPAPDDFFNG